jgi:serine protease Do
MTNGGLVAGGAVGAGVGAALAAPALVFIPPLGAVIVLMGVAAGMGAGQAMESGGRGIRYPDLISIPMHCGPAPTPAEAAEVAALPLGLNISGLPPARARELGLGERGAVLVDSVEAGGRAETAGIRAGDIILAANGDPLGDATDLEDRVVKLVSGSALTLRIWRQGQVLQLVLRRAPATP